jgi:hypothetical protein
MASAHLAHLWSPVRRVSYRSHQDAPDFSAMHPSCCCSPPPTLGPDAAYSYAVGAVKPPEHRRHRASGWPSGPRTPRRRPHDSMSCSRRGAHRPPPVTAQRVAELSTSAAGGVGAPAASPGRFGSKACCSAADRIADSPGFFFLSVLCPVGWWCAAQAFHLISCADRAAGEPARARERPEAARGRVARRAERTAPGARRARRSRHVRGVPCARDETAGTAMPMRYIPGQPSRDRQLVLPPHDLTAHLLLPLHRLSTACPTRPAWARPDSHACIIG